MKPSLCKTLQCCQSEITASSFTSKNTCANIFHRLVLRLSLRSLICTDPPNPHKSGLTSARWSLVVYQAQMQSFMTVVSNDPTWWPSINSYRVSSYFIVAAYVGVIYDWALTFGQEVELILRQRWSLTTVLYVIVRYGGVFYAVMTISFAVPTFSTTDAVRLVINDTLAWMNDVGNAILGVIMIFRLHAMYQQSRKMLIFLVVVFLAIRIALEVMTLMIIMKISGEELVLSGTHQCMIDYAGDSLFLASVTWILGTVWEVLSLCLAAWIAVKHFRELRRNPTRSIIGDCYTVLMQTHVSYFASFVAVSSFQMSHFSPVIFTNGYSLEDQLYTGFVQILEPVQVFILGPRLILNIREYHAKLVADSDAATAMTSIAFEERVHVETSYSV
ncbi:uncharacterized protein HD556DRAFT_219273 [Suillus plorans]|uniref:DUF6533 domain-containing protein n=1 Tax=Suillus plorans TaxID=116603 RepID=A0A9P7DLV4_9AGAM|nr:uncharacterized protein HD556DRAFT_219273 [Suillus plorans]KAG1798107.1 hypothetical protein HD556DRAFT_219273 [Suillus plorans]